MYEIYISETLIKLVSEQEVINLRRNEHNLIARYAGKTKFLLPFVDMLEKTDRFDSITIFLRMCNYSFVILSRSFSLWKQRVG